MTESTVFEVSTKCFSFLVLNKEVGSLGFYKMHRNTN